MEQAQVDVLSRFPTLASSFAGSDMGFDIILEPESELSDMDESTTSAQMEMTASCQDTPDTDSSSLESELSVASSASSSVTIPEVSSGPEDLFEYYHPAAVKQKQCIRCHKDKSSPLLYCRKCYMDRKRFLPLRSCIRKRKKTTIRSIPESSGEISPHSPAAEEVSNPAQVELYLKPSLCGCCMDAPCNGIFIHGDLGHQIFCYKCSHKVWLQRKTCPYCNRAISKVVKLFTVSME